MRAALAHLAELRRRARRRSPCSARWPSSARPPPPTTARSAPRRPSPRGRRRSSRSARSRASTSGVGIAAVLVADADEAADDRARARCGPATSCSSRARGRWDSRPWRRNYAADGTRPRRSARRADHLDPRRARSSSTSCAATRSARRSARKGPSTTRAKQGTPTMGGVLIVLAAAIAFLATSVAHGAGARDLRHDARLRRDRLPRRPDQGAPPPLARAVRARSRCCSCSRSRRVVCVAAHHQGLLALGLHPDRRSGRSRSAGASTCSSS